MLVYTWSALFNVHPSFAIIIMRKRELVALLLLSFGCLVTVNVMSLFLAVPLVGLQCVIVVHPDQIHSLSDLNLRCIHMPTCTLTLYLTETPFNAFCK